MQGVVTVLGKSPAWQDAGGACSGYLVRAGGYTLLVDCGSGVFGKLRARIDYLSVDAVVISHLHPDHILDLAPFSMALKYSPRCQPEAVADAVEPVRRPELHAPPGARDRLRLLSSFCGDEQRIERSFDLREYAVDDVLRLGPITARFCEVPHYVQCFAIDLDVDGRRFTFGADCAANDALVALAAGTDLLMLEATLEHAETGSARGHMTAREAGALARRAGARRLVVTHFSDELDASVVDAEATAAFGGEVSLAREGDDFTV